MSSLPYSLAPNLPALLPPLICAPKAFVISGASPQFSIESNLAVNEAVSILKFNKEFQYPQIAIPISHHSTASSRWQGVRKSLGLFYDNRSIQNAETYCAASPLGSLPLAVARAVGRANLEGGLNNPASILEIGAGQRRVSAGIKAVFGDIVINSEIAPAYSMQPGIDRELPASGIDDAELGVGNFDLIFSIFGNLYGKDQLRILGKVIDGLKSGGGIFPDVETHYRQPATSSQNQTKQRNALSIWDRGIKRHTDLQRDGSPRNSNNSMGAKIPRGRIH